MDRSPGQDRRTVFLFFASHDLHVPRVPHERFQGATPLGYRADVIVQLDWCVGELMKKTAELGIDDNTLFLFCSDNGPVMDDGYADFALEKLGEHRAGGPVHGRQVQHLRRRHPHSVHHPLEGPHPRRRER